MKIYLKIHAGIITDMRYLCLCDPTANVAIEILSGMLRNMTINDASKITPDKILRDVGSDGEELASKSSALVELIQKGLTRYAETHSNVGGI
jgi:NifU-like protein involved in Fe-S cluster formation